jgi:hypothetical protein
MDVSRALKWGARAGYAARGAVYIVVGSFAVLAAVGTGGAENTQGALRKLFDQPLGGVLLVIVGLGLLAFAMWRAGQAIGDFDRHGSGAKGLAVRFFLFCSGLIHLGLAVFVAGIVFSLGGSEGGGDPTGGWLQWLFGQAWGRWLALALALIPIGVGIAHIVKGFRASYDKYLALDGDLIEIAKPICSFGLIARGAIFLVVGGLALYAGGIYDAESAPGLEDALSYIQGLPLGNVLFLLVAAGLVAFALYCFIEAAYRRIGIPETRVGRV